MAIILDFGSDNILFLFADKVPVKWRMILFFILMYFLIPVSALAGNSLCAIGNPTKLYKNPDAKSPVSWVVGRYMPLKKIDSKGPWVQVSDLEGETHWVHYRNVSSKTSCLVISRRKTVVRTGPGPQHEVAEVPVADRYTPFLDLSGEEGWTRVQDDFGYSGWVNLDHTWKPTERLLLDFEE